MPSFFALSASVNEIDPDHFTRQRKIATPPKLLDSGASRTYTTLAQPLTNILAHCTTLQTATGTTTQTTQAGNMKVKNRERFYFLAGITRADVHGQLHIIGAARPDFIFAFTNDYVYLSKMGPPLAYAKLLGGRTAQNIYVAGGDRGVDIAVPCTQNQGEKQDKGHQRKH